MKTFSYDFAASVFPWIKGYIEITKRDIMLCYPNTAMWIIPDGKSKDIIPLRNISGVSIERYSDWKKFFIGLGMAMIGSLFLVVICMMMISTKSFGDIWNVAKYVLAFFITLVIGILLMMDSANRNLVIFCSGNEYDIEVPFFEAKKLYKIQNSINRALDYEADKYDMNYQREKLANEIGKAVSKSIKNE